MTKKRKIIVITVCLITLICMGAATCFYAYRILLHDNVQCKENTLIYIPTHSTYQQVIDSLKTNKILYNYNSFNRIAHLKKYPQKVKDGCYKITPSMSNNSIVNMLRSGNQEPVRLTFNNIRTKKAFAKKIAGQLEITEEEILNLLTDSRFTDQYHFDTNTILTMFIPNTYEVWWNISAENFMERMFNEYNKFWNQNRCQKAAELQMSKAEVAILASIVEEENHLADEQPVIAGLYINRLRKGMLLQADPTLKYALNDFTIQRILNKDKEIASPYNTYKYQGLPPGPIRIPSIQAIDAVLNYAHHDYLYMCAKEDFSGRHNFAKTNAQHERNAAKYRHALNQRGIKR